MISTNGDLGSFWRSANGDSDGFWRFVNGDSGKPQFEMREGKASVGFPFPAIEENCEERGGCRAICARRPRGRMIAALNRCKSSSLRTSTTQGSLRGEFGKLASDIEAEARSDSAELLATQLHPSWEVLRALAGKHPPRAANIRSHQGSSSRSCGIACQK